MLSFVVVFIFGLLVIITVLGLGEALIQALCLSLFEFRPIGWLDFILGWLYFLIFLPLSLFFGLLVPLSALFTLRYRRRKEPGVSTGDSQERPDPPLSTWTMVTGMALAAVLFGAPYWFLVTRVISPKVQEALHIDNWPPELKLSSFEVCATKIQFDTWSLGVQPREREYARILKDPDVTWGHSNCAWGRVSLEIVNESSYPLKEATFTVSTGAWITSFMNMGPRKHRLTVRNLAPGARGRIEQSELDLGYIWPGDSAGRRTARIYWDKVNFIGKDSRLPLTPLPREAKTYIGNCLRSKSGK